MKKNISKEAKELFLQLKQKGFIALVHLTIRVIVNCILYPYYSIFKSSKTFIFQKQTHHYFYHWYNTSWANERAVEVPIIMEIINKNSNKKILEVGNVLSHYFYFNHDILDKYEKSKDVINQDIINFQPSEEYELIVSISTLEHVGFDEKPKDPEKIIYAVENLKKILAPHGKIIITLPLGYNYEMDRLLRDGKIEFTNVVYLKKVSRNNTWKEVNSKDVQDITYNSFLQSANGLVIGIIEKNKFT
ncbi:MAG: hypothetical protein HZC48_10015 [Nitrospirae bacterium]|nr:hypothetical protein [Nitrospirota bacterium]